MSSLSRCLALALSLSSAIAMPLDSNVNIVSRETSCTFDSGETGSCMATSSCAAQGGVSEPGHCPGATDIQCCTKKSGSSASCSSPAVNEATISLLKDLEGFDPNPYPDAGKFSIGYGHQCSQTKCAEMTVPITQTTAISLMTNDLNRFETCLTNKIRTVTLNENQFGTLVSWAYNVGCGAMEGSTLVKRLLKGDDPNTVAQEELPTWRTSLGEVHPGLVARRKKEIALFQTDSSTMALPLSC